MRSKAVLGGKGSPESCSLVIFCLETAAERHHAPGSGADSKAGQQRRRTWVRSESMG